MRIKLINPNTTSSMTEKMAECARRLAGPGTEIVAVSATMGPASIESHHDAAAAALGVLDAVREGEKAGCDGYVIACFGDPAVDAAREVARGPVLGIASAAMHMASLIAPSFSVVTTLRRSCGMAWGVAERSGTKRFCRSVRAVEMEVLELERPGSGAREKIADACRHALDDDGAEAIVLGCAGMADLCDWLTREIDAPVVEGVTAAVKLVEALVTLGLFTAKRGEYAPPLPKPYLSILSQFSIPNIP